MVTDISALDRFAAEQPDHEAGHPTAVRPGDSTRVECPDPQY